MVTPQAASIMPSQMVEGGGAPVDMNLLVKSARFAAWDYQGKAPATVAARLELVADDGQVFVQNYSAGPPDRYMPSQDGKQIIPLGAVQGLSKSSNFYILMTNTVNAGFPENKLGADLSVLEGLYAFWSAVAQPKRAGLAQAEKEAVLSVPSKIHRLPWEAIKAGPAAGPAAGVDPVEAARQAAAAAAGDGVEAEAMKLLTETLATMPSISRADLAVVVFQKLAAHPNRDAIATHIFSPAFLAAAAAAGLKIEGEKISKA